MGRGVDGRKEIAWKYVKEYLDEKFLPGQLEALTPAELRVEVRKALTALEIDLTAYGAETHGQKDVS